MKKTFYFSGIEKKATADENIGCSAAGMMSQLLYSPNLMACCDDIPLLVMDSGAYTKELLHDDIEEYARLIIKLDKRCVWYAAPDCIGDQQKSNENYNYLLSLLPPDLHSRILWIYQYGSDLQYLYAGLKQHNRIGIGGLVPLLKLNKKLAREVISQLAKIIAGYEVDSHWFGVSIPDILDILHQTLPGDFSVDSTTWLMGGKYGLLIDNQGRQKPAREGGYDFSTYAILEQNVRTMRKFVETPVKKMSRNAYVQLSFIEVA